MLGVIGACILRETQPFRRASDNEVAVAAQYVVFLWASSIVLRDMGISNPSVLFVMGVVLVLATVTVFGFALWRASDEVGALRWGAGLDNIVDQKVEGQYLVQDKNGVKKMIDSRDFVAQYEPSQQLVNATLAQKGFQYYQPSVRYWARQLSTEDVRSYFPAGWIIGDNSKTPIAVRAGDYLVMASPAGDSLNMVAKDVFETKFGVVATDAGAPVPSQAIVLEQWEDQLRHEASVYRKTAGYHAKCMKGDGRINTVVNGIVESRSFYSKGDFVVRGSRGGNFVMCAKNFAARYDVECPMPASDEDLAIQGFSLFSPTGRVWAHHVSAAELAVYFPAGRLSGRLVGRRSDT